MKALCKLTTTVTGNKFTITGELIDVNFPAIVAQRVTISHAVAGHPQKPRHIQLTSHGLLVRRVGSDGVLLPQDELASVMVEIDSKLSDVPVFDAHPTLDDLLGSVKSEIATTAEVQVSDDGKAWTCIKDFKAGTKPEAGKFYRCVATNKNGSVASNAVHIPKADPKK